MNRRHLIALLGAAALPVASHAQQKTMSVIGWLAGSSASAEAQAAAAFREGLSGTGYIEGQNLEIKYRWAEGHLDRLPALASDLVQRKVDLILSTGGLPGARAAKDATSTIPIVFLVGVDPVATSLVESLARPGSNLTGFTLFGPELNSKRFELLSELVPGARVIAVLVNPMNPASASAVEHLQGNIYGVALAKGVQLHLLKASSESEVDAAFAAAIKLQAKGLLVAAEPLFYEQRGQITTLASRNLIPTMYVDRRFTDAGGLISYGTKPSATARQAGIYAGRILKGAKPADLPVQQPTTFELVINLKTAQALGLTVPQSILARADEVIE
jgi:putative ABC transport system substrate-binding protein